MSIPVDVDESSRQVWDVIRGVSSTENIMCGLEAE